MFTKVYKYVFILILLAITSSCATIENNHDPLEGINRISETFNDGLDRVSLKPTTKGYHAITTYSIRRSISNFYDNEAYLNTALNNFLQGKGKQGLSDLSRFTVNSTIGLAGLFDPARHLGLEKHNEDFGQTLAVWGTSQGSYIVYPLFGPNSVRKTSDFLTATATSTLFWASLVVAPEIIIPLVVLRYIDKRSRLLDISQMRDDLALDPYVFTREAWRQNREYLIYDGHPPIAEGEDDDDWEDDFGD